MKLDYRRDILVSVVAWAAFLVLIFVSVSAAGTQMTDDPAKLAAEDASRGGMHVQVSEGVLSVKLAEGVSLSQVLHAVAQQAGFRLIIQGSLGDVQPQEFTNVPLRKGIEWLVGNHNLVMIHDPSARLADVRVYEASHRRQAAIEPRPPRPPPEFWMWSRRLRQDSRMRSFRQLSFSPRKPAQALTRQARDTRNHIRVVP